MVAILRLCKKHRVAVASCELRLVRLSCGHIFICGFYSFGFYDFGFYGFGKTWTYNYYLKKQVTKAKFSITYFSKDEKVTVPVKLAVGVGL